MTPAELHAARTAAGWTLTRLAAHVGVTLRAVQHWERGTRPIPHWLEVLLAHEWNQKQAGK